MDGSDEIFAAILSFDEDRCIGLLRDNPGLVGAENSMGQTPFWLASYYGLTSVVQLMLREPCIEYLDHKKLDHGGRDAYMAALAGNNHEIAKLLEPIFEVGVFIPEHKRSYLKDTLIEPLIEFLSNNSPPRFSPGYSLINVSVFVVVTLLGVALVLESISGPTPKPFDVSEIIASGDEQDIEKAVEAAIKNQSKPSEILEGLKVDLAALGWSVDTLTATRSQNTIRCSIVLLKGTQRLKREILVRSPYSENLSVQSNFYDFPEELTPLKPLVIQVLVENCI